MRQGVWGRSWARALQVSAQLPREAARCWAGSGVALLLISPDTASHRPMGRWRAGWPVCIE